MLQNHHQHQGLIVEDHQPLGLMGFFSNPSTSNSLAFLHHPHPHHDDGHVHHESLKPFASLLPPSAPSDDGDVDVDVEDDDHLCASTDLHQSLLISCSNPNPRDHIHQHHHHQDLASLMGDPPHQASLHPSNPSIPWEWRSNGSEQSGEDHHHDDNVNIGNDKMMDKKSLIGVSALRMKKMKGRRKVREPRFSFKTLSDVDVLDDGYKWRKYGQKVVKNTQHPRSYYRCTQDNCRVKKRVERLAEDPRMVITSYEGRHVHSPSHDNPNEDYSNKALPILNNFFW